MAFYLCTKFTVAVAVLCMFCENVHSFSPSQPFGIARQASFTALHETAVASALSELAKMTTISIDSGDLDVVEKYAKTGLVTDATTNPLFVSQAGAKGDKRYNDMVDEAISYSKGKTCNMEGCDLPEETLGLAIDRLAVNLGAELAALIPGKVSTEVDIRLSYDTEASVERARRIIEMFKEKGISKDRVLIKLAGTWEGIQAAAILQKEGINCNITLVFTFLQAAAAAQAGAYLISPFPGRILDWHKSKTGKSGYSPGADPGVIAVKRMYAYFRRYDYKTICMPASWRPSRGADVEGSSVDEIVALAGVDEMTIPPNLLEDLLNSDIQITQQCEPSDGNACTDPDFKLDKDSFVRYFEADPCGQDKLKEGMDAFTNETEKLEQILITRF